MVQQDIDNDFCFHFHFYVDCDGNINNNVFIPPRLSSPASARPK